MLRREGKKKMFCFVLFCFTEFLINKIAVIDKITYLCGPAIVCLYFYFLFIFFNFYFYFILLYNTVSVLPYIDMNQPRVYMSSQSWTPLPPPSPYYLSGSSPCTSPKHPVSCIEPTLEICFLYDIMHVSMPFSQIIPPSPSPTESKSPFYTSVPLLLSHNEGYHYHLSKFHIYVLVYCISAGVQPRWIQGDSKVGTESASWKKLI